MVKKSSRTSRAPLNTTIISTIAKPIATKELIARLQTVADNLSTADQNATNLQDYQTVAADLVNPKLLKHNHKGVLAYACCGLADILRLYAPDAPYTPEQLTEIFKCFLKQFAQLWDEQNPFFLQQCYLLKRLVEVRLIILLVDLPDALNLIADLFDTMFVLAGKGFPTRLELLASEMLAEVFAEADVIPQKVVTLLLKKLTATPDSGLTATSSNISNPGLAFSLAVCESNVDKMSRHIAQLFSEMLDDSVKANNGATDYEASYSALEKIHSWSVQIWKYVPDLLASVMGLISDELNSDLERVRVLATTTIGSMVLNQEGSAESNMVHFVNTHKAAWENWLKKSSDVSPVVRAKWVEQVPEALCAQSVTSDTTGQLSVSLAKCLSDTNERVRFAACKACELLPFAVFASKVCTEISLRTLFQLVRERNLDIHSVAVRMLADIYNTYLDLLERDEVVDYGNLKEEEIHKVEELLTRELPNTLIQLNYVNDKALTAIVDVALFEKLIPFQESSSRRVSRLCRFVSVLDEKSKASFLAVVSRQKKVSDAVRKFTELSTEYMKTHSLDGENKENEENENTGGEKELLRVKVEKVILWLTATFPTSINGRLCLERFHQLRNARLINLMANCVAPDANFKTVKNSLKELFTKLGDPKNLRVDSGSSSVTAADMISTMKILLYRASNIFFNLTNTSELVKLSKDESSAHQKVAYELINQLLTIFPDVFKNQIKSLSASIVGRKTEIDVSLIQSFSHFMNKYPEQFPEDAEFAESLQLLAIEGTPQQARYAVKILRCCDRKELLLSDIIEKILPLQPDSVHFATHLSTIAETYLALPIALDSHSNAISAVIVEEVLRKNRIENLDELFMKSTEWINDLNLDEKLHSLTEKLISIRLITNRVRSVNTEGKDEHEVALLVEKPLKLLMTIVSNSGEIVKARPDLLPTPPGFKQKLRLAAGLNILKLAKYPAFNMMINNNVIMSLTRLLHDECADVRDGFMRSLEKKLSLNAVSERFLHLVFFAGHEPNEHIKRKSLIWIASNLRRREEKNDIIYERVLARLIHAISHDSRFVKMILETDSRNPALEVEAYVYALKYISMYLEIIAKEENVSLLYYIASRVKQYRDAQVGSELYGAEDLPDEVINLYRVSELCQLLIKELADSRSWTLQTWPGKMKLPLDLFAPMDDYQEAQKIISMVYISDSVQIELRQSLKMSGKSGKVVGKSGRATGKTGTATKRKAVLRPAIKRAKPAKKNVRIVEESEDEDVPVVTRRSTRNKRTVKYTEEAGSEEEKSDEEYSD